MCLPVSAPVGRSTAFSVSVVAETQATSADTMPPACSCRMRRMKRVRRPPATCWQCCGCTTTSSPATEYGRSFSAGGCPALLCSLETVLARFIRLYSSEYMKLNGLFSERVLAGPRVCYGVVSYGGGEAGFFCAVYQYIFWRVMPQLWSKR